MRRGRQDYSATKGGGSYHDQGRDRRDQTRSPLRKYRSRDDYNSRSRSRRRDDGRSRRHRSRHDRTRHDDSRRYRPERPRDRSRDTSHGRDGRRKDVDPDFYERRYVELLRENDILRDDIRTMQVTHQEEVAEMRQNAEEAFEAQERASRQLREDLRSARQELQAKEVLLEQEKNRLLEKMMSVYRQYAEPSVSNEQDTQAAKEPELNSRVAKRKEPETDTVASNDDKSVKRCKVDHNSDNDAAHGRTRSQEETRPTLPSSGPILQRSDDRGSPTKENERKMRNQQGQSSYVPPFSLETVVWPPEGIPCPTPSMEIVRDPWALEYR
ncbi:unnamed protein product [Fusarium equiseti]|uniref:Uncharacterized protein n=1 Tax=Fusarium equiseti TaxID=61235 RepID=A0A8J2IIC2_FUSEQ|nr:unnamed protein product [Fusarium equiseti]